MDSIRVAASLAKLWVEERAGLTQLWTDVMAVLKNA